MTFDLKTWEGSVMMPTICCRTRTKDFGGRAEALGRFSATLTELLPEKSLAECLRLTASDLGSALDGIPADKQDPLLRLLRPA